MASPHEDQPIGIVGRLQGLFSNLRGPRSDVDVPVAGSKNPDAKVRALGTRHFRHATPRKLRGISSCVLRLTYSNSQDELEDGTFFLRVAYARELLLRRLV